MIRGLLVHTSKYTLGNLLVTLAGFISFPIFARVFSVDEYGLMNLIATTLSLAVGLGKLGIQHSIVRFYAETRAGKKGVTVQQYFATVIGAMAVLGAVASMIWLLILEVVPDSAWHDPRVVPLLRLATVLVFVRIFESALVNLLRAEQRSGWYSAYMVVRRYVGIAIILVSVLYLVHGLEGFYLGTIVAESLVVFGLAVIWLHRQPISIANFNAPLFKTMLMFGVPMIGYEIGGVILSVGDRYVLQAIAGPEPLGYYSAAYNMCEYVQTILLVSIGQAVTPMYTRIWEDSGPSETIRFISRVLHFYLMLAAFVVAAMAAVGHDLLTVLASAKYLPGASIIPWVLVGMVLDGCIPIVAAGIFIRKQTQTLMMLVLASAALNIALNFALVPTMGIMGSAVATAVSYVALTGAAMVIGYKRLAVPFPVIASLKFCIFAGVSYWVMREVTPEFRPMVSVLVKGTAGAAVFGLLVVAFDKPARNALRLAWVRGFPKVAGA